jgi:predicted kinase
MKLSNTVIVLFGFAGTGKYTIGRELCELTGARLIDNQIEARRAGIPQHSDMGFTATPSALDYLGFD